MAAPAWQALTRAPGYPRDGKKKNYYGIMTGGVMRPRPFIKGNIVTAHFAIKFIKHATSVGSNKV
jgi:hypothetical protein